MPPSVRSQRTSGRRSTDIQGSYSRCLSAHLGAQSYASRPRYDEALRLQRSAETHELALELKFDNVRQFWIRLAASELDDRPLPPVFTNVFKKKGMIECQTLELAKRNQKVLALDI